VASIEICDLHFVKKAKNTVAAYLGRLSRLMRICCFDAASIVCCATFDLDLPTTISSDATGCFYLAFDMRFSFSLQLRRSAWLVLPETLVTGWGVLTLPAPHPKKCFLLQAQSSGKCAT